jgi:hypothetical protein
MGYQDYNASQRDAANATVVANAAQTKAEAAIANANLITATQPKTQAEAAKQQAAIDTANAAVQAYNAAAKEATTWTQFANTGWFGPSVVTNSSKIYSPTDLSVNAQVQGLAKTVVSSYYSGTGANRVLITVYSDGTTSSSSAPESTTGTADEADATAYLTKLFESYGLGTLAPKILEFVQKGYKSDTISLLLQDTPEYKSRFAANEARKAAGLPVLSPKDYLATESAYGQTMKAYGLPAGFYDNKDDFTKLIAADVSPTELNNRIATAADVINNADPFVTASLKNYYGLSTGDMIANVLDPTVAKPLIEKQVKAAEIGGAAASQNWGIGQLAAESLAAQNVTKAQAQKGFATIAGQQTQQQKLAEIWGGDTAAQGQNLVASTFGTAGAAYADQQIKAIQQKEINAFSGSAGAAAGSLGAQTTPGGVI